MASSGDIFRAIAQGLVGAGEQAGLGGAKALQQQQTESNQIRSLLLQKLLADQLSPSLTALAMRAGRGDPEAIRALEILQKVKAAQRVPTIFERLLPAGMALARTGEEARFAAEAPEHTVQQIPPFLRQLSDFPALRETVLAAAPRAGAMAERDFLSRALGSKLGVREPQAGELTDVQKLNYQREKEDRDKRFALVKNEMILIIKRLAAIRSDPSIAQPGEEAQLRARHAILNRMTKAISQGKPDPVEAGVATPSFVRRWGKRRPVLTPGGKLLEVK